MKIPVISIGDKVTGTADSTAVCFQHIIEGNAKFRLEISENSQLSLPFKVCEDRTLRSLARPPGAQSQGTTERRALAS